MLPALVEDFEKRRAPSLDTAALEARAHALASGEIPDAASMPASEATDTPVPEQADVPEAVDLESDDSSVDPVLLDIFESEAETHLQTLQY